MKRSRIAAVLFGAFLISAAPYVFGCAKCSVSLHRWNDARIVRSLNLTQECPGSGHSAPFGNWGVVSNKGDKIDGYQFAGWCHNQYAGGEFVCGDGWYEWNSCTSNQGKYPVGSSEYYNYPTSGSNAYSSQVTKTGPNQYSTILETTFFPVSCPREGVLNTTGGCRDVHLAKIFREEEMKLYELDPLDPYDDFVVSILYLSGQNALETQLSCDAYSCEEYYLATWNYAEKSGVGAWAKLKVHSSGLTTNDCSEGPPGPVER